MRPFWPSGRLWEKFLIGLFYVPGLFSILIWLFVLSSFTSSEAQAGYFALFLLALIGGPVTMGLFLRTTWGGVGGMLAVLVAVPMVCYVAPAAGNGMQLIDAASEAGIAAMGIAFLLEVIAGDAHDGRGRAGLIFGVGVGVLLMLANQWLASAGHTPGSNAAGVVVVSWWVPVALVSLSVLFFPDWLSKKVGFGGVLVWAALVAGALGLSAAVMR